jgi:hypothetical protein
MNGNLIEKIFLFVGIIAVLVFISFLLAWPTMILWNACLVPAVSGLKEVEWTQAWGIQILAVILFGQTGFSGKSKK